MRLPPLKRLVKKLDKVFSDYIRLRDTEKDGNARCCTCGKIDKPWNLQCGHFIKRQHRATRWEPLNAHLQCSRDNLYLGGAQDEYARFIIRKYGQDRFDWLMAEKHKTVNFKRYDYEYMIGVYEELIEEMK